MKNILSIRCTRREWQGSYTVEAALIFPMIFFVLSACIITSFYIHDRGVSQSMMCEISMAASNTITTEERKEVLQTMQEKMKSSRFLGSRNVSVNTSSGRSEIHVTVSSDYPVPGIPGFFPGNQKSLTIKTGWQMKIEKPGNQIRLARGAAELLNGGSE